MFHQSKCLSHIYTMLQDVLMPLILQISSAPGWRMPSGPCSHQFRQCPPAIISPTWIPGASERSSPKLSDHHQSSRCWYTLSIPSSDTCHESCRIHIWPVQSKTNNYRIRRATDPYPGLPHPADSVAEDVSTCCSNGKDGALGY